MDNLESKNIQLMTPVIEKSIIKKFTPKIILCNHLHNFKIKSIANYKTFKYYEKAETWIGLPVFILSFVVSFLSTSDVSGNISSQISKTVLMILSLTVSLMTGIRQFFKLSAKVKLHYNLFKQFEKLFDQLNNTLMASDFDISINLEKTLKDTQKVVVALTNGAEDTNPRSKDLANAVMELGDILRSQITGGTVVDKIYNIREETMETLHHKLNSMALNHIPNKPKLQKQVSDDSGRKSGSSSERTSPENSSLQKV